MTEKLLKCALSWFWIIVLKFEICLHVVISVIFWIVADKYPML